MMFLNRCRDCGRKRKGRAYHHPEVFPPGAKMLPDERCALCLDHSYRQRNVLKDLANWIGGKLLAFGYDPTDDPGAWYDNQSGLPCPACNVVPEPCSIDGMTHDPCLGHIKGATSACCGHGYDMGHVQIGMENG